MRESEPVIDARAYRDALGCFATGVTVVTACGPDGRRVGLTASSFNSVSLDPPLVLWSLDKSATSLPVFKAASHYAVNVLAADQTGLSQHFARTLDDKFNGVPYRDGVAGAPLLQGCVAWFECRNAMTYEGGDHLIFVGEVERFDRDDRPALLFHGGRYGLATAHPELEALAEPAAGPAADAGNFVDDYLLYLLARANHLVNARFYAHLKSRGVSLPEWRVLVTLAGAEGIGVSELAQIVLLKQPTLTKVLDGMQRSGLIERRPSAADRRKVEIRLTDKARPMVAELKQEATVHEASVLAGYGPGEAALLKTVLRTLISRSAET